MSARKPQPYAPVLDHRYNLPPGTPVVGTKVGRSRVDVWPDARGGFTYCVHGEMSGVRSTFEEACAEGLRRAANSQANYRGL